MSKTAWLFVAYTLRFFKQICNHYNTKVCASNLNLPSWVSDTERHPSFWTEQEFQAEGFTTSVLGQPILALYVEDKKMRVHS